MKKLLLLSILLTLTTLGFAQTYKIVISYDANGNRIKRERVCVGCSQMMSVSQKLPSGVNLYPNPTNGQCFLQLPMDWLDATGGKTCQITVSDATGKVLQSMQAKQTVSTLDLSAYTDATYWISVTVGNERKFSEKVVKLTR